MFLIPTLLFLAAPQATTPPPAKAEGPASVSASAMGQAPRIQWFGTLEQGLAEAKRTNRPLMMTAAAPVCRGIPGKW